MAAAAGVVADAAGVGDLQLETLGVDAGDLVRAVAVVAHGQLVAVLRLAREVDAAAEGLEQEWLNLREGVGQKPLVERGGACNR